MARLRHTKVWFPCLVHSPKPKREPPPKSGLLVQGSLVVATLAKSWLMSQSEELAPLTLAIMSDSVIRLKIELDDTDPPIWRTIEVPAAVSLEALTLWPRVML